MKKVQSALTEYSVNHYYGYCCLLANRFCDAFTIGRHYTTSQQVSSSAVSSVSVSVSRVCGKGKVSTGFTFYMFTYMYDVSS